MTKQAALTLFVAMVVGTGVAFAGPAVGEPTLRIGVTEVEASNLGPQLAKRLRGTVLDALKAEGLQTLDLIDTHPFIRRCDFLTECLSAALAKVNPDYVLMAKVAPSAGNLPNKPEYEIEVRLGRMPHGRSVWGPWPMTTNCQDCSDTEMVDSMRQLVTRTWKAMQRAELPPEKIEIAARDRRNQGARLIKQASAEGLSAFDQVYLLKQAIRAGDSGPAYLQLAWIFFGCEGYEEAEDYATRATSRGTSADKLLAPLLWFTGRWAEALPVFQRLARDFSDDKHWQRALDELKHRIQDPGGMLGQAEMELQRGDAFQAARFARIALATGRGLAARHILAKAHLASQHYADALAQFIGILHFDPNNIDAIAGKQKSEEGLRKIQATRARR